MLFIRCEVDITLSNNFLAFLSTICYYYFMERRPVTFRIDPAIIKKLKYLALDHDRTLTDLFLEAIQDLLRKYEKKAKE